MNREYVIAIMAAIIYSSGMAKEHGFKAAVNSAESLLWEVDARNEDDEDDEGEDDELDDDEEDENDD